MCVLWRKSARKACTGAQEGAKSQSASPTRVGRPKLNVSLEMFFFYFCNEMYHLDTPRCELVEVGSCSLEVHGLVADVVPAHVIDQDEEQVRLGVASSLPWRRFVRLHSLPLPLPLFRIWYPFPYMNIAAHYSCSRYSGGEGGTRVRSAPTWICMYRHASGLVRKFR